jgi:tetratricopeptide (TPR) repeat protein
MHRLRSISIALPLLFLATAVQAQPASILDDPVFQTKAKQGLEYLYNMDFGAADQVFGQVTLRYPDHPVGPFLQALIPWWSIQLEPDDTFQDEVFLRAMDEVIEVCDRRLDENPGDVDAMFFKSGAHAFRGRLHADRRRWLKAARDGQQALSFLKKVREREPDNDDLYFGIGLFDYLADAAPRRYRVLRPFKALFPKGDRDRGLRELERARTKGQFVPTEVTYALLQIHYVFEEDYPASLGYALWLRQRHPDNSLFHLYEGRIYEQLGQLGAARRILNEVLSRHAIGQSGYTDAVAERALYLLTRTEMRLGHHDAALAHIERLDRLNYSRRNLDSEYRGLSKLRRGMVHDVKGERAQAVRCYKEVLAMKDFDNDSARDRAKEFLKRPYGAKPKAKTAAGTGRSPTQPRSRSPRQ